MLGEAFNATCGIVQDIEYVINDPVRALDGIQSLGALKGNMNPQMGNVQNLIDKNIATAPSMMKAANQPSYKLDPEYIKAYGR